MRVRGKESGRRWIGLSWSDGESYLGMEYQNERTERSNNRHRNGLGLGLRVEVSFWTYLPVGVGFTTESNLHH